MWVAFIAACFVLQADFKRRGLGVDAETVIALCALAGIIGAIRSGWDQTSLTPDDLRNALNAHARKTEGPAWNERLGNGIINVKDTLPALPSGKY